MPAFADIRNLTSSAPVLSNPSTDSIGSTDTLNLTDGMLRSRSSLQMRASSFSAAFLRHAVSTEAFLMQLSLCSESCFSSFLSMSSEYSSMASSRLLSSSILSIPSSSALYFLPRRLSWFVRVSMRSYSSGENSRPSRKSRIRSAAS